MTADLPPMHDDLDFNSPCSDEHAAQLVRSLGPLGAGRVLDIACGWGELLLRVIAANPGATGTGLDLDAAATAHARELASARGLAARVQFRAEDAAGLGVAEDAAGVGFDEDDAAINAPDVVLCVGASQVWGDGPRALRALRTLVPRGGRVLYGEGVWNHPPGDAALAGLGGASADEFDDLAGLVERAVATGFRPLRISTASVAEWDAFESGYALGYERWLMLRPSDDPDRARVLAMADEHRRGWLGGYRGVLGFAYLTLVAD